ncbi:MAG: Spo0B domain-containing protein, partial [Lachnospiraceae bacterium]|nr:Spo0B domain-containing protein [Lachnospiraceae bacterium]
MMNGKFWLILIGAVLLVVVIAVLVTIKAVTCLQEKRMGEYQDKVLKTQRDEVQAIYRTMRGWRHDYHNHMQTIKAYLSMNQVEETL